MTYGGSKYIQNYHNFFIISPTIGLGRVLNIIFFLITAVTPYVTLFSSGTLSFSFVMTTKGLSRSWTFPWRMWCPIIMMGCPCSIKNVYYQIVLVKCCLNLTSWLKCKSPINLLPRASSDLVSRSPWNSIIRYSLMFPVLNIQITTSAKNM